MQNNDAKPKKLLDQLRDAIRVRHYSIRTEHTYCDWVKRYCHYHNLRHPMEMGAVEINQYLSHLATDCDVAASTQNQALNAIVFLYKHVLKKELDDFASNQEQPGSQSNQSNQGPTAKIENRGCTQGALVPSL